MGEKEVNKERIRLKYQKTDEKRINGSVVQNSLSKSVKGLENMEFKLEGLYNKIREDEQTQLQKYKNKIQAVLHKIGIGGEPRRREIEDIFEERFTFLENLAQKIYDDSQGFDQQYQEITQHKSGLAIQMRELRDQATEVESDMRTLEQDKSKLESRGITSRSIDDISLDKLELLEEYTETLDLLRFAEAEGQRLINKTKLLKQSYLIYDFYAMATSVIAGTGKQSYDDIMTAVGECRNFIEYHLNSSDLIRDIRKADELYNKVNGYLKQQAMIMGEGLKQMSLGVRVGQGQIFDERARKNLKSITIDTQKKSEQTSSKFYEELRSEMGLLTRGLDDDIDYDTTPADPTTPVEPVPPIDE